ncbi:Mu-like prophage tail protein gpP [Klebsiella pneumoniae]|uniref:Mu-like prophage tail protein gpP n=1 Tax=Klebsiella pneumoniae TaxID=573 RepID=A0AB74GT93_KLEPN|nr:Mu-like prophage tail protein gpP [Klebsiella pneumoniae]
MTINRSLDNIAGEFASDRSPPDGHLPAPRLTSAGAVLHPLISAPDRVLTGYIDDFIPSYDSENVSLRVMGREQTGDLVDSSVVDKSGQWKGQKLEQLAATICKPYGIEVVNETDTGDALAASPSNRVKPALNFSTGWPNSAAFW